MMSEADTGRRGELLAGLSIAPAFRHGEMSHAFAGPLMGDPASLPTTIDALSDAMKSVREGERRVASDMLTSQAITLDTVFTEMLRRSANNLGKYPDAAERYMRLALKAQANSRATLEVLARLHQPREQTVKHVHVNAGGQAVVADEFHHHAALGGEIGDTDGQAHTSFGSGQGRASLSSPDPFGAPLPQRARAREEAVPHARRREGKRCTERE